MMLKTGKFPILVLCLEVVFIIIYGFFVTYSSDALEPVTNDTTDNSNGKKNVQDYYSMFQHVNVMIFAGFGFLMTFLKRYGYSAVGLNMLLATIAIQWAIIMQGVWKLEDNKIPINIINLINGNFASATVLISYGVVLGKTSPLQLVVMTIIEITIFGCNEHLGLEIYKAVDIGGSIFLHTYGAYFGLAVSYMIYRYEYMQNDKEGSNYHSDIFSVLGTIFLWLFWPSFNSATATGGEQLRSITNTFVSLLACTVVTFSISSFVDEKGRLNMVHIQNATLAGGVAIGTTSNMIVHPFGAMIIGSLAGIISTVGYKVLTPFIAKRWHIYDTCGVNNLHGMPGILAGLTSAVVALMAKESDYGVDLYRLYPGRSPVANSTNLEDLQAISNNIEPGLGWSETDQAHAQLAALCTTIAVAIGGGLVTGFIIRQSIFNPPKKHQLYDDSDYWEVPDDDHP